jgi:hypothetical protein
MVVGSVDAEILAFEKAFQQIHEAVIVVDDE